MALASIELDLDVFSGPFDLLLTLVLREEVDLLELPLADVVLAYLDHLERRGELDLEAATEFVVLLMGTPSTVREALVPVTALLNVRPVVFEETVMSPGAPVVSLTRARRAPLASVMTLARTPAF